MASFGISIFNGATGPAAHACPFFPVSGILSATRHKCCGRGASYILYPQQMESMLRIERPRKAYSRSDCGVVADSGALRRQVTIERIREPGKFIALR